MSTIPKGSLILVTGVNGYIASHTANRLLKEGYLVRGTVRAKDKADWLYGLFDKLYGKFHAVVVPDMHADDAFKDAVKGVDGICHMGSVMSFSNKTDEVIPAVVKGAVNIMTAALTEPRIKSLVYTSSSTAALMPQPDKRITVTKDTWDDESVNAAQSPEPDAWNIYGASKTLAEKAVWAKVQEAKPSFQVTTVLPNANEHHSKRGCQGLVDETL